MAAFFVEKYFYFTTIAERKLLGSSFEDGLLK